jgi:hypothetical protein
MPGVLKWRVGWSSRLCGTVRAVTSICLTDSTKAARRYDPRVFRLLGILASLSTLYDFTFRPNGSATKAEGLTRAYDRGVVCTVEMLLHPDPYPNREACGAARLIATVAKLSTVDPGVLAVFVNHHSLVREPTRWLFYPEFAQWWYSLAWRRRGSVPYPPPDPAGHGALR